MTDDDEEALERYAAVLLTTVEVAIRHKKIRELIQSAGQVPTPEELAGMLAAIGITATAAEVAHDLRDIAFLHGWERE